MDATVCKHYFTHSRAAWPEVISKPEQFILTAEPAVVFVHVRVRPRGAVPGRTGDLPMPMRSVTARQSRCAHSPTDGRKCVGRELKL